MDEQEKIGIAEFKTFLAENMKNDTNVDIVIKQFSDEKKRLEEEFGQEVPAFYSNAKNYMMRNSVTIDSSGRIDVNVIKQVSAIVKKEVEKQQEINNYREKQEEKNFETESLKEEVKEKIKEINFSNISPDEYIFCLQELGSVLANVNAEEIEAFGQEISKNLDGKMSKDEIEKIKTLLQLGRCFSQGESIQEEMNTPENIALLESKGYTVDKDGKIIESDTDGQEKKSKEELAKNFLMDYKLNSLKTVQEMFDTMKDLTDEEEKKKVLKTFLSAHPEIKEFCEEYDTSMEEIYLNKEEINEIVEDLQSTEPIAYSIEKHNNTTEMSFENELDALFDDMFAEMEDPAKAIEIDLDEEQVEQTLEDLPEDQPQPELADEEVQNEATEEVQDERQEVKENIEEVEEEIQEEAKEEIPEEQYEAPTFEEEKTGLAGLFSRIANSRAAKAVTNLFKPKEEQKKLNAPANQRVEDGVRFTDYESNGSLLPATIQTRNFFRNFAINTVEAVTKFAKNISGRGKQDNQVINTPTVIKSEPTKAQTEKTVTQEQQQTVEKTETFNDTNKWAVSNEAIQRQDAINKAQERNNLSYVAAPKQEELQSEEDKSFEEI